MILGAIRQVVQLLGGKQPSRREFLEHSGLKLADLERFFPKDTWSTALSAAGFDFRPYNQKIPLEDWLRDWADLVRKHRGIPTRKQYKVEGKFSPGVFENHCGAWSTVPTKFRECFGDKPEWVDVLALIPEVSPRQGTVSEAPIAGNSPSTSATSPIPGSRQRYPRLDNRPSYGMPIDFRGLRHEPVNEQGVVFLFGMVARELGYMVEAVQTGFPDCEAIRQAEGGRWQRVRIEFEFESRNYNHPLDGCDVIVCWRHNWPDCPPHIEVLELKTVIESLSNTED